MSKPSGVILAKYGPRPEVFGIWPSGLIRQITRAEWKLWGAPIDYAIEDDADFNDYFAFSKALRA